jgi:signal transduction histidine kinase
MMEPDQQGAIAKIQLLRGDVAISVNLSWCKLDDADLDCLKCLPQLQELYLSHTDVTDAGLEHLKGLVQLQTLDLSGTKVTDAGLQHFRGLPELEKLCFWATGGGLKHLRGLPRLRELDLGGTKVTDAGLEHLKGLWQLQELGLSGTEVTDAGLEHLKGLRQLRTLDLSFTLVKGPLDPTEWESQGLQFVGLDAAPVPRHAAGLGHGQANELLRPEIKERRQTEEQSLKEQQYLRYLLEFQDRDRQMVSYEIHDGFVQQLAAAIMQFAVLGDVGSVP